MEQENFFFRLKKLRETCGWSQKDLGKEMGVSSNTVQSWEKDTYPKGDALIRLSELLKCSIDWLLTGKGHPCDDSHQADLPGQPGSSNVIELQHMALVKGFRDKQRGLSINQKLIELEALDAESFNHIEGYITGTVDSLRRMKSKMEGKCQDQAGKNQESIDQHAEDVRRVV
jgi:transcriptional regulator with XRE-family HTH domain